MCWRRAIKAPLFAGGIAYEVEGAHFRIWIALLVSYVALRLLEGDEPARA